MQATTKDIKKEARLCTKSATLGVYSTKNVFQIQPLFVLLTFQVISQSQAVSGATFEAFLVLISGRNLFIIL